MRINKIINKEILSWYVTELSDLILTEVCDIQERRIYLNEKSSFYMIQDPKIEFSKDINRIKADWSICPYYI